MPYYMDYRIWTTMIWFISYEAFLIKKSEPWQDKRSNNEWNRCIDENSIFWGRCIYDCDGDDQCENQCVAEFKLKQEDCPCEVFIRLHNILYNPLFFRKTVSEDAPVVVLIAFQQQLLKPQPQQHHQILQQRKPS